MANKTYSGALEAGVSATKLRVEQIKSEDGFTSLSVDLEALRGQIKDIIGAADYKEEITGEYAKVQIVDLAAHIDASGASSLSVKQAANVVGAFSVNTDKFTIAAASGNTMVSGTFNAKGAADLDSTLNVDGAADMKSTLSVTGSADFLAAVVARSTLNAVGAVDLDSTLNVDGVSTLASAKISSLTSGRVPFAGTAGVILDSPGLAWDGSDLLAASAKINDLTQGRLTFAGPSGALVDSSKMTFASGVLTVSGSTFGNDVTIAGNLTVQGATTTVDTQNLIVKDAKIVISSGGIVDGAGIYLASDSSGENIAWNVADDKWIVSDKLAAGTLQATDLTDRIVWADASGNLIEITDANLGAAVRAELAGTVNQIIIGAADPSTGISILSLPQDIHSNAAPEFEMLNLGSYGMIASASSGLDLKISAMTGILRFDDGLRSASTFGSSLKLAELASDWSNVEAAYGSEMSLLAMLTAAAPSTNTRYVWSAPIATAATDVVLDSVSASAFPDGVAHYTGGKSDVFVNGQLMSEGSGRDFVFVDIVGADKVKMTFSFALQIGDVVTLHRVATATAYVA